MDLQFSYMAWIRPNCATYQQTGTKFVQNIKFDPNFRSEITLDDTINSKRHSAAIYTDFDFIVSYVGLPYLHFVV